MSEVKLPAHGGLAGHLPARISLKEMRHRLRRYGVSKTTSKTSKTT
jgi:hypothetical protein